MIGDNKAKEVSHDTMSPNLVNKQETLQSNKVSRYRRPTHYLYCIVLYCIVL